MDWQRNTILEFFQQRFDDTDGFLLRNLLIEKQTATLLENFIEDIEEPLNKVTKATQQVYNYYEQSQQQSYKLKLLKEEALQQAEEGKQYCEKAMHVHQNQKAKRKCIVAAQQN